MDAMAASTETAAAESTAAVDDAAGEQSGIFAGLGEKMGAFFTNPIAMAAVAGAAIVGVGAYSLDMADKFDKATNSIAASAGISQSAAKAIGDSFLNAGNTTIYTGTQIASAYASVAAQLGSVQGHALDAAQAQQVMNAAQNLATASGESLGTATTSLAGVMQVYQINAGGAANTSNVLYETAKLTGNSVSGLAGQVAKMAAGLGVARPPLDQVGGLLEDMAAHGETGRKGLSAVTSGMSALIKTALMTGPQIAALTGSAALNEQQFQSLGLSVIGANGKFEGMGAIIAQLQPKLEGMTQAQQLQTLGVVFGTSAAQKMLTTIMAGPAVFNADTAAVSAAGTAHAAAAKQLQNLGSMFDEVKTKIEDMATRIGELLMPVLVSVGQSIMGVTNFLMSNKDVMVGVAVAVGALVVGLTTMVAILAVSKVATLAQAAATGMASAATGIWSGVTTVATGVMAAFDAVMDANPIALVVLAIVGLIAIGVLLITHWQAVVGMAKTVWTDVEDAVKTVLGDITSDVGNFIGGIVTWFEGLPGKIASAISGMGGMIGNAIKSTVNNIPVIGSALSAIGLAAGGRVTKPTLALVGESGPEVVIPESQLTAGFASGVSSLSSAGLFSRVGASSAAGPASAGGKAGGVVYSPVYNLQLTGDALSAQAQAAIKSLFQQHDQQLITTLNAL
jgi:TP901 family phage tail tape measure protein